MYLQDSVSVAAGATNKTQLNGTLFQFSPGDGVMDLFGTGSAIGLRLSFKVSGDTVVEDSAINSQNRFPVVPDDEIRGDIPVDSGELIQMEITNPTAGALTFFYRIEFAPEEEDFGADF